MKDVFGKEIPSFRSKKLFLLDMDGTVYVENQLFDGIANLLQKIKKQGGRYAFISNNSSLSVRDYQKKLKKMGVIVTEEELFSSAQASAIVLRKKFGDALVYAQGTKSFIKELKKGGLNVTQRYDETAVAILVGYDPELSAKKMRTTCRMLYRGIPYFAANPDLAYNVSFGYVPDCGSMCQGYENATGRKPTYIGKPEPTMIDEMRMRFGATKEQTVVFGDRLYTDIASGLNAGIDSVCVLTGEATKESIAINAVKPTYTIEKLTDVEGLL